MGFLTGRRVWVALFSCFAATACPVAESDPDAVVQEAVGLMQARNFGAAIEKMRALADANPDDAEIQSLYGEALLAAGQPSLAVWPLSRAMRDPQQFVKAGLLLASAQLEGGSHADAAQTASRLIEADADNQEALLLRAKAYLNESLEEKAIADLDRIEEKAGPTEDVEFLRLDALLGLNRETEADALLKKLTEEAESIEDTDPSRAARLCAATAMFTFERGDLEGAKTRFDACLEGDGLRDPLLFTKAANFFDEHGELARTTALFERRFELDPSNIQERVLYADRLQKVGRFSEGEKLLLEATKDQTPAWAGLADLYAFAGDYPKALDALSKAIAASPTRHEDWIFSKADFQLVTGDVSGAEQTLKLLEVPAHRALITARLAAARGDLEAAVEAFDEGIRLWPDNADARYLAAQVHERLGDWKSAAAQYREAARMDPPHYESSLALASLQRALGDTEGVSFLLLRLADERPNDPRVIEKLIEFAVDTGAEELGMRMLRHLARLPGQGDRALVLASGRAERAEGAEAAIALLERAKLDLSLPEHLEALSARTRLLIELQRWDEALAAVDAALTHAPESADLLVLRAGVQRAKGAFEPAVADLERARARAPERYEPAVELSSIHEEKGEITEARRLLEEAVRLELAGRKPDDPPDHDPVVALARLERRSGEVERARDRLLDVLDEDPRNGTAAWLLLQSYADSESGSRGLESKRRRDLALRAGVFEGSPEARDYLKKLNAEQS